MTQSEITGATSIICLGFLSKQLYLSRLTSARLMSPAGRGVCVVRDIRCRPRGLGRHLGFFYKTMLESAPKHAVIDCLGWNRL